MSVTQVQSTVIGQQTVTQTADQTQMIPPPPPPPPPMPMPMTNMSYGYGSYDTTGMAGMNMYDPATMAAAQQINSCYAQYTALGQYYAQAQTMQAAQQAAAAAQQASAAQQVSAQTNTTTGANWWSQQPTYTDEMYRQWYESTYGANSMQQNCMQQNVMQQNVMQQNGADGTTQNAVQQNAMQQNTMQQNIVQQNIVQQNIVQQNTVPQGGGYHNSNYGYGNSNYTSYKDYYKTKAKAVPKKPKVDPIDPLTDADKVAKAQDELNQLMKPLECDLCNAVMNSSVQAKLHYMGKPHQKKVSQFLNQSVRQAKLAESQGMLQLAATPAAEGTTPAEGTEGATADATGVTTTVATPAVIGPSQDEFCNTCKTWFTSKLDASQHYAGKKHIRAAYGLIRAKNGRRIVAQVKNEPVYYEAYENPDGTPAAAPDGTNPAAAVLCPVTGETVTFVAGNQPYLASVPGTDAAVQPDGAAVPAADGTTPALAADGTAVTSVADAAAVATATTITSVDGTTAVAPSETPVLAADIKVEGEAGAEDDDEEWEDDEDFPAHLYCEICDVVTNCDSQLEIHKRGAKHRKMLRYHGLPDEPDLTSAGYVNAQYLNAAYNPTAYGQYLQQPYMPVDPTTGPYAAVYTTPSAEFPAVAPTSMTYAVYRTPSGTYYCPSCNATAATEFEFATHMESASHKQQINPKT